MMDCRTFDLLLDVPETEWTPQQREEMEAHAAHCPECAALLAIRREMQAMDGEEALPDTFSASWRKAIFEEENTMSKSAKHFNWKRALAVAAAVVLVCVGTTVTYLNEHGGSARSNSYLPKENGRAVQYETYEYEGAAAYDYGAGAVAGGYTMSSKAVPEPTTAEAQQEKIIRTVNISLRTQQFEQDYEALRQLAADCGGRVESLSMTGDGSTYSLRNASLTFRIPSARLDSFISGARGIGTVSSYNESSDDVSANYHDIRTRLETQQAKLERLTQLMERADNVEDLIELENAISDAQYWIDYYTGQLNSYDSRVADSYVYVSLRELSSASAADDKQLSLGERIVNAIEASIEALGEVAQSFVVFLIAALPWLVILTVVIVAVRLAVRSARRRRREKKAKAED